MNIEQLKAELAAKVEANKQRVQEAAEVARLEATLRLENSEELFQARVRMEAAGQQTATLQRLVDECAAIIASTPVMNTKTRTERQWAGSHKYGYGTQVDLMYQLATGILYSCQEHKALLLQHTGLDMELIEQVVKAFGNPTYYSRNNHVIVEEKDFDMVMMKSALDVMQSKLGVVIDTSSLSADAFRADFERAKQTAQDHYDQAMEAINGADFLEV